MAKGRLRPHASETALNVVPRCRLPFLSGFSPLTHRYVVYPDACMHKQVVMHFALHLYEDACANNKPACFTRHGPATRCLVCASMLVLR